MLALTVNELCKRFPDGTQALSDVSFEIEPGQGVMLIGSNGSGKSTLLHSILRLEDATSGNIYVGDVDTTKTRGKALRMIRCKVGMVFQQFHLISNLSAFHNVLQGSLGRSRGPHYWLPATAPEHERRKVMECLERVGLDHLAERRADALSGGQQQRVAIARMLMQEPELVLADEPVSSLDPRAGKEVLDLLWEIGRERRMTVLCTIHRLDLALEYAERVIGLKEGRLVLDLPAEKASEDELKRLYGRQPAGEIARSA